jgi:hypothetical protein
VVLAPVAHGITPGLIPPVTKVQEYLIHFLSDLCRHAIPELIEDPDQVYQPEVGAVVFTSYILQGSAQHAPIGLPGIIYQGMVELIVQEGDPFNGALRIDFYPGVPDRILHNREDHKEQQSHQDMPESESSSDFHFLHVEFKPFTSRSCIHEGKAEGDPGYHGNPDFQEGTYGELLPVAEEITVSVRPVPPVEEIGIFQGQPFGIQPGEMSSRIGGIVGFTIDLTQPESQHIT